MKRYLIACVLTAMALHGAAQTAPATLTLEECRRLAIENNAKVKVADGDVASAKEVSREAFTNYFPNINANWMGFRSNKGVIQYTLPSVAELLPAQVGAMVPPQLGQLFNESLGSLEFIKKGWTGAVTALQPVFAGGRIVNGNRLAHVGEEAAACKRENAVDEVTLTTDKYYWQLVALKSKRSTLERFITMVDTLERQVNVAVNAGVVMRNDLLKVRLRRNELLSTMVDLDNGIVLSRNLLAQHIGRDGQAVDVEAEVDAADMPEMPAEMYVVPQEALSSVPDYRLLDASVRAAELRKRMAVGENLPTVGVGAGWFYDDLISQKHNFGAVMLAVSVPISDWWGGSHKIKESRIAVENARLQQEDLSQMLCIAMSNAWDDVTSAHRKMQIAKESIGEAAENLRLNENYYRVGTSTITDLLDAQALYRQSLDQYTEAYGNFRYRCAQYLKSTGRLSPLSSGSHID